MSYILPTYVIAGYIYMLYNWTLDFKFIFSVFQISFSQVDYHNNQKPSQN